MKALHLAFLLKISFVVCMAQNRYYENYPPNNNYQEDYRSFGGSFGNNNLGSNLGNGPLDLPDPNVPRTIRVLIPQPYPVHVNVEQPVQIPVYRVVPQIIEKPVPYTVEKPFPVEVKKLYPVEVIKKVEVSVPKPYPVPYTVYKHILVEEQTYKLQAKQDGGEGATEREALGENTQIDPKNNEI